MKQVKVVPAKSGRVRIWNLSDSPRFAPKAGSFLLFGKNVAPGKSVLVSAEEFETVKARVYEIKGLVVGDNPPEDYLLEKGRIQAKAPKNATRTHGPKAPKKESTPASPKTEVKAPAPKAEAKVEPSDAELEELTKPEEETPKPRGRRGK